MNISLPPLNELPRLLLNSIVYIFLKYSPPQLQKFFFGSLWDQHTFAPHFEAGRSIKTTPSSFSGISNVIPGVYSAHTRCTHLQGQKKRSLLMLERWISSWINSVVHGWPEQNTISTKWRVFLRIIAFFHRNGFIEGVHTSQTVVILPHTIVTMLLDTHLSQHVLRQVSWVSLIRWHYTQHPPENVLYAPLVSVNTFVFQY